QFIRRGPGRLPDPARRLLHGREDGGGVRQSRGREVPGTTSAEGATMGMEDRILPPASHRISTQQEAAGYAEEQVTAGSGRSKTWGTNPTRAKTHGEQPRRLTQGEVGLREKVGWVALGNCFGCATRPDSLLGGPWPAYLVARGRELRSRGRSDR